MADVAYVQRTAGDNKGPWVVGVCAGAISFTAVAVALRCWSRTLTKAGFWWDDWTILISLPFTWALLGLQLSWVSAGLGRHVWAPGVQQEKGVKINFASQVIYVISITIIRMSVVLFYGRVFGPQRWVRIVLRITFLVLIGWFIGMSGSTIFQCSPVRKVLDHTLPGHCDTSYGAFIGVTVPNFFIDLLLLLLPLPVLWKLQMTKTKKVALTANFLLGYIVIVVTILRLEAILSVPSDGQNDFTWTETIASTMFTVEPAVATVSICLPAISSLVTQGFKRIPKSSIRVTWSRWSGSRSTSRNTPRSGTKRFGPLLESFPYPGSRPDTANDQSPWLLPIGRHNTFDDKKNTEDPIDRDYPKNYRRAVHIHGNSPASGKAVEQGTSSDPKSIELERRVLGYYQRSEFPHTSANDLEKGARDNSRPSGNLKSDRRGSWPLSSNPLPLPPESVYEPCRW